LPDAPRRAYGVRSDRRSATAKAGSVAATTRPEPPRSRRRRGSPVARAGSSTPERRARTHPRTGRSAAPRTSSVAPRPSRPGAPAVGNGIRSGNWFAALLAPFISLRPTRTSTVPTHVPPQAAAPAPPRPPTLREEMGLPAHPLLARKQVFTKKAPAPVPAPVA